MKRLATVILSAFFCVLSYGQDIPPEGDAVPLQALGKKLDEYCLSMVHEGVKVQSQECDYLIGSAMDSLVRQYVAVYLYEKYLGSDVMGSEGVAVHIFDRWFADGKVSFKDDITFLNAKIFADFNRQSLVGCTAPEITMKTLDADQVTLFGESDSRFKVLFFYDTGCPKCRVETILLRNLFDTGDYPVEFYPVYVGQDMEMWMEYVSDKFDMQPISAKVTHLWNPEDDFRQKYGILQTPRLFLVAPDNTILGRSLDSHALSMMLDSIFGEKTLEYGSAEALDMIGSVLSSPGTTREQIGYFADRIAGSTLPKGDTLMFRQMTGDLLYYLSGEHSEECREGLKYLIDNYVNGKADIWKSKDDSLKIIGFAMVLDDLLSRAEPGTKIPAFKIHGRLQSSRRDAQSFRRLDRLPGKDNIIIFYTQGCGNCDAQKAAADAIIKAASTADSRDAARKAAETAVFYVNADRIRETDKELANRLFDSFDLSVLPHIIITDRHGIILRRYVSLLPE